MSADSISRPSLPAKRWIPAPRHQYVSVQTTLQPLLNEWGLALSFARLIQAARSQKGRQIEVERISTSLSLSRRHA